LNAHGNPTKHFGDLDLEMSRKKLDQIGAIGHFLRQVLESATQPQLVRLAQGSVRKQNRIRLSLLR